MSNEILNTILTMVVVPILLALTTYILAWLKKKTDMLAARIKAEKIQDALYDASNIIANVVTDVMQTFVKGVKAEGVWTEATGRKAKQMAMEKIGGIMSKATKDMLKIAYDDVYVWLNTRIEAEVERQKDRMTPNE